eukprot:1720953-Prymnesium_polylepis.1
MLPARNDRTFSQIEPGLLKRKAGFRHMRTVRPLCTAAPPDVPQLSPVTVRRGGRPPLSR